MEYISGSTEDSTEIPCKKTEKFDEISFPSNAATISNS